MHFRICCCCNGEEKQNTRPDGFVIPSIIVTEQPKAVEPIQLDRITEVSVEESSTQSIEEDDKLQAPTRSDHETPNQLSTTPVTQYNPSPTQAPQQSNVSSVETVQPGAYSITQPKSHMNFNSTIGDDPVIYNQIGGSGNFRGTFKESQFTIINGRLQSADGAYSILEKELIMDIYRQAKSGMERGMQGLQAGILATMPSFHGQQTNLPAGTNININYTSRSGESAVMTFIFVAPGHFKSIYNGKDFSILNGQILTTDGDDDFIDKELILNNFKMALLGMKQGMLGMQQGMLGMEACHFGMSSSQSSYNVLATGQDTLKRMRSLKHGKRTSILDGGLLAQPRQPVMVIEDITEKANKSSRFDEVDGSIREPTLPKTTFTPNAIIYEDPETYEELDKNELPKAQRLDEYIISADESVQAGNRYYFHEAKPRRVTRKELSPKEQLQIASLDRYTLFENESVKVHNEFRKIHGVPPLINNEFLCQVAREWAEHLALKDAFYHRPNNDYGENLYYADGMPVCAKKAVKAWYDEIDLYDYNNPKFSKETGHFTQLVWKDTREVGTGVAQIGDKVWVCCNYHPPGNFTNKFNDEYIPRPIVKSVQRY